MTRLPSILASASALVAAFAAPPVFAAAAAASASGETVYSYVFTVAQSGHPIDCAALDIKVTGSSDAAAAAGKSGSCLVSGKSDVKITLHDITVSDATGAKYAATKLSVTAKSSGTSDQGENGAAAPTNESGSTDKNTSKTTAASPPPSSQAPPAR